MEEDLKNLFFCASRRNLNNVNLFEKINYNNGSQIPFANVNILLNNRESVKGLLSHKNINRILSVIPSQMRTLIVLENFKSLLHEESLEEQSKKNLALIFNYDYNIISFQEPLDEMPYTSSTQLSFNF